MALLTFGHFRSAQHLVRGFATIRSRSRQLDAPRWRKTKVALLFGGTCCLLGSGYYSTRNDQERRQIRVAGGGIVRFFRTSFIGSTISLDYQWSLWNIPEVDPEYVKVQSEVHKRSAERILRGCLKNGGLYIKLGQGLVIMDHVLPKEYINTLRVLQNECLVRSPDEVHQLFQEEFQSEVTSMFQEFDEKPIAAASLAQVFKATTKEGEKVAVKVQYLDLQNRFAGDIATLTIILNIAGWLHKDFDFAWVLNELKGTLEKELNFLLEAKNSERCAKDLKHLPFVYVPKVLWDYSSPRVLTTEFIDGIKISDTETLLRHGIKLDDLDHKLFSAFSEQIFYTGFVHADPHPGNILVRKNDNQTQLVILDHGLYEDVPSNIREALRNLWKAMVLNDHDLMKKYSMELGIKAEDYRLFCIAIGQRYISASSSDKEDSRLIRLLFAPQKSRNKLTPEEKAKLNIELSALRNRSLEIFKAMPSKLMLVTRFPLGLFQSTHFQWYRIKKLDTPPVSRISRREYLTFAEMLTQLPMQSFGIGLVRSLTKRDEKLITQRAKEHFDEIMAILKKLPNSIILILRNINTIRSIARGHGDPVNRYNVMARCAAKGTFETKQARGPVATFKRFYERANFEVKLWIGGVRIWWWKTVVNVIVILTGRKAELE